MTANLRRFTEHKEAGAPYTLDASHMAVRLGTSLFREGRLQSARFALEPLLKTGHHNRKIGKTVLKGRWKGAPIYTLTLEERATCPRACVHYRDCFGNKMNWPTRFMADASLIPKLGKELANLSRSVPKFVVRLHVLGDFYSVAYVRQWARWLEEFPALHVYGYSAWQPGTPIGDAVAALAKGRWDRFAVRTSNGPGSQRTTQTIYDATLSGTAEGGIVCPVQTGKTECCATCALCWQTERKIVFLAH
jgi:hypothetical protein